MFQKMRGYCLKPLPRSESKYRRSRVVNFGIKGLRPSSNLIFENLFPRMTLLQSKCRLTGFPYIRDLLNNCGLFLYGCKTCHRLR
uniref:Uncharacterized protein n=1 Tax=Anopheles epiroticus TaxID=199890 RepID=A0A182PUJ6_9DIPT